MRRRVDLPVEAVPPCLAAILLAGHAAEPPGGREHHTCGWCWSPLLEGDDWSARQWQTHRDALLATAQRWGWAPAQETADGRTLFWAEALSASEAHEG
jgi:hypothetical protein